MFLIRADRFWEELKIEVLTFIIPVLNRYRIRSKIQILCVLIKKRLKLAETSRSIIH